MFLNVDNVGAERTSSGRLFQATGPATQNARLFKVLQRRMLGNTITFILLFLKTIESVGYNILVAVTRIQTIKVVSLFLANIRGDTLAHHTTVLFSRLWRLFVT